jgi:hypothetical protein
VSSPVLLRSLVTAADDEVALERFFSNPKAVDIHKVWFDQEV